MGVELRLRFPSGLLPQWWLTARVSPRNDGCGGGDNRTSPAAILAMDDSLVLGSDDGNDDDRARRGITRMGAGQMGRHWTHG